MQEVLSEYFSDDKKKKSSSADDYYKFQQVNTFGIVGRQICRCISNRTRSREYSRIMHWEN